MKGLSILGSTGSIGRSTLSVVESFPDSFRVVALTSNRDIACLEDQVRRFHPRLAVVADPERGDELERRLASEDVEVLTGPEGLMRAAALDEAGIVVSAIVGVAGLLPTREALRNGKVVALANKESLAVAGELLMAEAGTGGGRMIPVDSEQSALFQCLQGEDIRCVEQLILTASGGPFWGMSGEQMKEVTVKDALRHPRWEMGAKVSIDSATLMNKGLEVLEAHWLFGIDLDRIDVLIQPESLVHSLVRFVDGSVIAQISAADMRIPLQYALFEGKRVRTPFPQVDLADVGGLRFARPDTDRFPCLGYCYQAGRCGGTMPAAVNAANEVAVQSFLDEHISFEDIASVVKHVLENHRTVPKPGIEQILAADRDGRKQAEGYIKKSE